MSETGSAKCERCKLTWTRRLLARVWRLNRWMLLCRDCREEVLCDERC